MTPRPGTTSLLLLATLLTSGCADVARGGTEPAQDGPRTVTVVEVDGGGLVLLGEFGVTPIDDVASDGAP